MNLTINDFEEHDVRLGTIVYRPDDEAEKQSAIEAIKDADGWFVYAVTSDSGVGVEVLGAIRQDDLDDPDKDVEPFDPD